MENLTKEEIMELYRIWNDVLSCEDTSAHHKFYSQAEKYLGRPLTMEEKMNYFFNFDD